MNAGHEHIDGRATRDPAGTTDRLLEAAAAEFIERGYDRARVSDIARRAELTVGSIYARWRGKTEIIVAALDHIFDQILPERRIDELGLHDLPLPDLVVLYAVDLLQPDTPREVFTQVFGSARNNPEVHLRLQRYLKDQFDQMSRLVERGKEEGITDPELSTAAITLFMQALGVGVHMVMSSQLASDYAPHPSDWAALVTRLINAARPPSADQ